LRRAHYISVFTAILLIPLLYVSFSSVPPKKQGAAMPTGGAPHSPDDGHNHAAEVMSTAAVLESAYKGLEEHARKDVDVLAGRIRAIPDSAGQAPLYDSLAALYRSHGAPRAAAFYRLESGRLARSPKNLNFAGQIFLEIMHQDTSAGAQMWSAQQAVRAFNESLAIQPADDTAKMSLAAAYIEGTGETMNGVQQLLSITRADPEHAGANLMLGRLDIVNGETAKAITRLSTVLKKDENNREALYFLAEAYKVAGNKAKAIELFERCKRVVNNPDFSKDIDTYIKSFR
jgi:tetratricopeptide (TPR) repeat protein